MYVEGASISASMKNGYELCENIDLNYFQAWHGDKWHIIVASGIAVMSDILELSCLTNSHRF